VQTVELKSKGQYTHPNPLTLPSGAMLVADNVVIDREDTTEQRRGFKRYGASLSGTIQKLFNYKNRLLVHHGSTLSYDSDGAGTWVDYSGTYTAPTGATRIRGLGANKNFYFATSAGIYKLDSLTAVPGSAGMAKGLDGSGVTSGASGFMANSVQVAYRVVWGKTDANNNKILGAPSQRIIVANTAGATRTVDLTFSIPLVHYDLALLPDLPLGPNSGGDGRAARRFAARGGRQPKRRPNHGQGDYLHRRDAGLIARRLSLHEPEPTNDRAIQ
jgi:hypothetical protein